MRVMSEEELQKLAEFIKQYARDNNGESPSLAGIMEYMGMVNSTAYRHILKLEKRGIISYSGKNTLETPSQKKMHMMSRRIPVVGDDRVRYARRAGRACFKIPCRSGGVA